MLENKTKEKGRQRGSWRPVHGDCRHWDTDTNAGRVFFSFAGEPDEEATDVRGGVDPSRAQRQSRHPEHC